VVNQKTGGRSSRPGRLFVVAGVALAAIQFSCSPDVSGTGPPGADACTVITPYTLGTNTTGQLANTDCALFDGSFIDYYSTTLTSGWYIFDMSAGFATYLFLRGEDGSVIGIHDDVGHGSNTTLKALLPAGNYVLGANAYPNSTGGYSLSSTADHTDVSNCEVVFVARGTSTAQSLVASDCDGNTSYTDDYIIFISQGQSITVTLTSSAFDAFLELYDVQGRVAVNDNGPAGTDAIITYTSLASGFYVIKAESADWLTTGAYTISIQSNLLRESGYFLPRPVVSIEKNGDFTTGRFWSYDRLVSTATALSRPGQFTTVAESRSL
jgi:hypothetical protein